MDADPSTTPETRPLQGSQSPESEQLRAALARIRRKDGERPQPEIGDQVGRYTVLGRVGQGGMGVVYKAYDPQLDRNVALKVLRRVLHDDEHGAELRLLREAQTLAHLQHPNVVAVFDAGLCGHGVFIAMELVEGQTLRKWLGQRRRRAHEILEVFRAAGRGLAAVHEAGVVHRDFKPSNVIVGEDGSVRVLDFGVASLNDSLAEQARGRTSTSRREVDRPPGVVEPLSGSGTDLTDDGMILGTPAYMAPEQIAGEKADHRSEQFTFCVCLHLALYDRSPVHGEDFEERRWHMARGQVLDGGGMLAGRTHGRVPAGVRRALRRGLAVCPADRFPSMSALLDELEDPPRRWPHVIAGTMLACGFTAGALVFDADRHPCADTEVALARVWGDEERDAVRVAFVRSGHPQGRELGQRVQRQLDGYADAWMQMHDQSCRATFVEQQQSERLHDQRVRCLERRRNRMRSAVEALERITQPQEAVERTLLPFQLPRIADCADLEVVRAELPLPADPELRDRIAELRRQLDEAETLEAAGDVQHGLTLARAVVDEARRVEFPPLLAEALGSLGHLQAVGGSARQAQTTLEASIIEAARAGDDATAARAFTWLLYALVLQRRLDVGRTLEFAAWAAVERAGDEQVRGWLLNNLGALYGAKGDFERALEHLVRALEIKQRLLGLDHVDVGISWFNLGTMLVEQSRLDDAHGALLRARSIFEGTVGPAHPLTFHAIGGLCEVESERGHHEAAVELCAQVLEHYAHSPSSQVTMARNHFLMARSLWHVGRREDARVQAMVAVQLARAEDPHLVRELERWLDGTERALVLGRSRGESG